MCSPLSISTIPAIVLVSSRHSGAICTVLIVLQALRVLPADCFAVRVAKTA